MNESLLVLSACVIGVIAFVGLCTVAGAQLPVQNTTTIFSLVVVVGISIIIRWLRSTKRAQTITKGAVPIATLVAVGTVMALSTAYQLVNYIMLPVDLLSFAESPFVNDILKLRLGLPIYTTPSDNNSYPYAPGTQILTYLISTTFGYGNSIPFYRSVQFSYVIVATFVATSLSDLLARKFLTAIEYRHRPLWIAAWLPLFFLLATDPRFNEYTHSLHNDGLALLLSVTAFWLMVKHSFEPRPWVLGFMTILPALGFMIKQSLVLWAGVFFVYLATSENVSWRQLISYLFCSISLVAGTVGACYLLWGDPFLFWTFVALGQKSVSLLRSVLHLLQAGMYAIIGMFGGWVLVLRDGSTRAKALWVYWFLIFAMEVYTSGLGWHANHLGPGIVIGACWFFPALVRIWPTAEQTRSWFECRVKQAFAVSAVVLALGGLDLVRIPRNPIPSDLFRYVNDIEKEFIGFATQKVLMDTGNWIYLRENTLMKDRSETVGIWVGKNQQIDRDLLSGTIRRIEEKTYEKILARQLDTDQSWYDFQDRGSGVKAAILANYQTVGRVAAVQGVETWWPKHLLAEVLVLVPKRDRKAELSAAHTIPFVPGR